MRAGTTKSRAPSGVERVRFGVSTSRNPAEFRWSRIAWVTRCRSSSRAASARDAGRGSGGAGGAPRRQPCPRRSGRGRLCGRQHLEPRRPQLDLPCRHLGVDRLWGSRDHLSCTEITHSERRSSARRARRALFRVEHHLHDSVRSRRSTKMSPPWSRRRCTHPATRTMSPTRSGSTSPHHPSR